MIQKRLYNPKRFPNVSIGFKCEKYVRELILKELKKSIISHSYNDKFDLLLYYRNKKYSIEVKACKRYLQLSNGYTSDGKFKFGNKIFDNKPHIVVFCIYYRKFREVYYTYGKDILKYLKRKNTKTAYCITIKQMKQYLKPKKYIYPIIEKIDIYG